MIAVDASALIAYLDPNDAHHDAAVEALTDAVPPLLVHPITAADVLVAPTRRGVHHEVWADLLAIGVEIDHTNIDPMRLAQLRVTTGCRMPDCCVLAVATEHLISVLSFDERLTRAATQL